ncbi:MAG: hypothetical protein Kow0031_28660 [Anaerolineae bacterium]
MDNERRNRNNLPYVLTVTTVLSVLGLIVWIIQLARSGDMIGNTILTVLLMLLALPVLTGALVLMMWAFGRWINRSQNDNDWQVARQSQKLMMAQIQDLQNMLLQMQRHPELAQVLAQARHNPALLTAGSPPTVAPAMQPGQMMTAEGFVVDGARFNVLDSADVDEYDENGGF